MGERAAHAASAASAVRGREWLTHPGIGAQNYGIKLTATFACLLLYLWTLVAPYALRDSRDFGI